MRKYKVQKTCFLPVLHRAEECYLEKTLPFHKKAVILYGLYCAEMIFLGYLILVNLVAFCLYGADKRKAQKNKWRVPERTLLWLAFLGGAIGAWLGMRRFRHKTQHTRFRVLVPLACLLWLFPTVSLIEVCALKTGKIIYTPLMLRRSAEALINGHDYKRHYQWVAYADISPTLTRAVMASEDNLFATHNGFSEQAIQRALKERKEGKVRHGGSTISQQTAKNVFTFGTRTYWRKAREAWFTVLIEQVWGKERIMEVYLNVIETGDGIYGAEAAARQYFGRSAAHLNASQSALIAVCLPSPRRYSVTRPGPYVRRRQTQILNLMPKLGKIELPNKQLFTKKQSS